MNAWEDHYGHIFSSVSGTYLKTFIEAYSRTGSVELKDRIDAFIGDIDHFWNGKNFIMGFIPNGNGDGESFDISNYERNEKLDSASLELVDALISYQSVF